MTCGVSTIPTDGQPVCSVCGAALTGDPDDDPWHPTGPVCGDCVRARADDELLWALGVRRAGRGHLVASPDGPDALAAGSEEG